MILSNTTAFVKKKNRNINYSQTKKRTAQNRTLFTFLGGFEPPAFRLGGGRSILLSYRNINHEAYLIIAVHKGQGLVKLMKVLI